MYELFCQSYDPKQNCSNQIELNHNQSDKRNTKHRSLGSLKKNLLIFSHNYLSVHVFILNFQLWTFVIYFISSCKNQEQAYVLAIVVISVICHMSSLTYDINGEMCHMSAMTYDINNMRYYGCLKNRQDLSYSANGFQLN